MAIRHLCKSSLAFPEQCFKEVRMRLIHVWKAIRHVVRAGRSRWRRIVSPDLQQLDDYILRDIGLEQHVGGRAEAWWQREVTPRPDVENLRK